MKNYLKIFILIAMSHMNTYGASAASAAGHQIVPAPGESMESVIVRIARGPYIKPTPVGVMYDLSAYTPAQINTHVSKKFGRRSLEDYLVTGIACINGVPGVAEGDPTRAIKNLTKAVNNFGDFSASLHLGMLKLSGVFNPTSDEENKAFNIFLDHALLGYTDHLAIALDLVRSGGVVAVSDAEFEASLNAIIAVKESPFARFMLGELAEKQGNLPAAVAQHHRAVTLYPTFFSAMNDLAVIIEVFEKNHQASPVAVASLDLFKRAYEINNRRGADFYIQSLVFYASRKSTPDAISEEMFSKAQAILERHIGDSREMLLTAAEFYAERSLSQADLLKANAYLNQYLDGKIDQNAFVETLALLEISARESDYVSSDKIIRELKKTRKRFEALASQPAAAGILPIPGLAAAVAPLPPVDALRPTVAIPVDDAEMLLAVATTPRDRFAALAAAAASMSDEE